MLHYKKKKRILQSQNSHLRVGTLTSTCPTQENIFDLMFLIVKVPTKNLKNNTAKLEKPKKDKN